MTTLTIDENIQLSKQNYKNVEELYYDLQKQIIFELHLQKKAQEAMNGDDSLLIDL